MREIFLLSEDFISRISVTGVWGQRPRSKSEQPNREDNNFGSGSAGLCSISVLNYPH
jgi:hypothetical protein